MRGVSDSAERPRAGAYGAGRGCPGQDPWTPQPHREAGLGAHQAPPPTRALYQRLSQHVHGRAGFPQRLLGQRLRLARRAPAGRLADLRLTLLWLRGCPPGRLVDSGEGPLVVGQGLELQRGEGGRLVAEPLCGPANTPVYTAGSLRWTRRV